MIIYSLYIYIDYLILYHNHSASNKTIYEQNNAHTSPHRHPAPVQSPLGEAPDQPPSASSCVQRAVVLRARLLRATPR